ncbi:hypothetical protein ACT7DE_13705 [Bacillus paranthracis]
MDSEEPLKETDRVIKKDIFHFLKALLELISEQDLLQFGTIPENSEENAGWEDEQKILFTLQENVGMDCQLVTSFKISYLCKTEGT